MTKIRERYEKAKTLAERGATEGERQAAQAAMERMEAAHPELVAQPAQVNVNSTLKFGDTCWNVTTNNAIPDNVIWVVYSTAVVAAIIISVLEGVPA